MSQPQETPAIQQDDLERIASSFALWLYLTLNGDFINYTPGAADLPIPNWQLNGWNEQAANLAGLGAGNLALALKVLEQKVDPAAPAPTVLWDYFARVQDIFQQIMNPKSGALTGAPIYVPNDPTCPRSIDFLTNLQLSFGAWQPESATDSADLPAADAPSVQGHTKPDEQTSAETDQPAGDGK
jgi:hypothetical protein